MSLGCPYGLSLSYCSILFVKPLSFFPLFFCNFYSSTADAPYCAATNRRQKFACSITAAEVAADAGESSEVFMKSFFAEV
jgi:hypothetical protein